MLNKKLCHFLIATLLIILCECEPASGQAFPYRGDIDTTASWIDRTAWGAYIDNSIAGGIDVIVVNTHILPDADVGADLGTEGTEFDSIFCDDLVVSATSALGAATATSYGGITEADLLDKTATETITDTWAFDSSLVVAEMITPDTVADFGQYYTKSDNHPYFQDGAGTEHTLLTGLTGVQHEFFSPIEDATGTVGNWDIVAINNAQAVHFNFQIPEDFEFLDAINIIIIPDASETIQWDINVSVAAAGEAYNNDDRATADATLAVTQNLITELDISGDFGSLSAGDYIAVDFQSDINDLRVVGLEFDFN